MCVNKKRAALVDEATRLLSSMESSKDELGGTKRHERNSEKVLAAGVFGLEELMLAQVAGGTTGALGPGEFGGDALAAAAGLGLGGRAAKEAYAAAHGVTLQLLVAVTETSIHVLNREGAAPARIQVARFDRGTTQVSVTKMGLSRLVELADRNTGERMRLHGSVAPFSAQSRPDRAVLQMLAGQ